MLYYFLYSLFNVCVVELALRPTYPVGFLASVYTNNTVHHRSQFPLAVVAVCVSSPVYLLTVLGRLCELLCVLVYGTCLCTFHAPTEDS